MSDIFKKASSVLLDPAEIDRNFLDKALSELASRKIDFGDMYFEKNVTESFFLEEGIVKGGSYDISNGVGVRAVLGEKTGFAYSDVIDKTSLIEACKAARSISSGHECGKVKILTRKDFTPLYTDENPIDSLPREIKVSILEQLDKCARSLDKRVIQVMASLGGLYCHKIVVNTDGTFVCDIKPTAQLSVTVIMAGSDGRMEQGFASTGGAYLFDRFTKEGVVESLAKEAVRSAAVNMEAIPAPAGTMPVVLGAGWPGVLIHEAVGHGLEGDFNRTKSSAFSDKVGTKVASSACTIIDDGTIKDRRGSLSCDDEGTVSQHTVLIENGILKGYMQDRQNAMLMGVQSTGNGRRESYSCLPLPRMTNTYMLPGNYTKDEIISSVKDGIYAVNFSGGQVDITSGKFVFSTSEAYLIKNGKIDVPIKGATLIGNGPEVMNLVSMVGNDLKFDAGIGTCGKNGQSVAVGIGQPTLKVDALTVGGTQA